MAPILYAWLRRHACACGREGLRDMSGRSGGMFRMDAQTERAMHQRVASHVHRYGRTQPFYLVEMLDGVFRFCVDIDLGAAPDGALDGALATAQRAVAAATDAADDRMWRVGVLSASGRTAGGAPKTSYHWVWEHVWVDLERARRLFGAVARALAAALPHIGWLDPEHAVLDPAIYGTRCGFRMPFADKWLHDTRRPAGRPMWPKGYATRAHASDAPPDALDRVPGDAIENLRRLCVRAVADDAPAPVDVDAPPFEVAWASTGARSGPGTKRPLAALRAHGDPVERPGDAKRSRGDVLDGERVAALAAFVRGTFPHAPDVHRVRRLAAADGEHRHRRPRFVCETNSRWCSSKGGEHVNRVWFGVDAVDGVYQGCYSDNTHDGVPCRAYHRESRAYPLPAELFSALFHAE